MFDIITKNDKSIERCYYHDVPSHNPNRIENRSHYGRIIKKLSSKFVKNYEQLRSYEKFFHQAFNKVWKGALPVIGYIGSQFKSVISYKSQLSV